MAKFHRTDTDTDTDFLADFRARILARKSACPALAEVGARRAAARSVHPTCRRTFVRRALFFAKMSVEDARACTRVRVLYMINYRVHGCKITR